MKNNPRIEKTPSTLSTASPLSAAQRAILVALFASQKGRLTRRAAALLGASDEDEAEDAVQALFVALLEARWPIPAVDVRRRLDELLLLVCNDVRAASAKRLHTLTVVRQASFVADTAAWRARKHARGRDLLREEDEEGPR